MTSLADTRRPRGKSRPQDAILAELPELVPVTGDDPREYHPDYLRLVAEDPLEMPHAAGPVSGGLIRLALDYAIPKRFSVFLEGTFRDEVMITGTAVRFAEVGYRVEVVSPRSGLDSTPRPISQRTANSRSVVRRSSITGGSWLPRWRPVGSTRARAGTRH